MSDPLEARALSLAPHIVEATLGKDVEIGVLSDVSRSTIGDRSRIYRMARMRNSHMGKDACLGDGSRLDDSTVGDFVRIDRNNHIFGSTLGSHTYTGQASVIMRTQIGRFTSIAWNVTIGGAEHDALRTTAHSCLYNPAQGLLGSTEPLYDRFENPCVIGNDVWIGAGAVVLRGVHIGDGAVIGANSVVTKDVPAYTIVAGTPAQFVRERFPKQIVKRLLALEWWNMDDLTLRDNLHLLAEPPHEAQLSALERLKNLQN
jgi:acetyltransferase-like isoleucine patch superfamily enzyme